MKRIFLPLTETDYRDFKAMVYLVKCSKRRYKFYYNILTYYGEYVYKTVMFLAKTFRTIPHWEVLK